MLSVQWARFTTSGVAGRQHSYPRRGCSALLAGQGALLTASANTQRCLAHDCLTWWQAAVVDDERRGCGPQHADDVAPAGHAAASKAARKQCEGEALGGVGQA
jgi:hypothetical protein